MQFVLASHNQKKLREMDAILRDFGVEIALLPEGAPEPDENGETFEENALIKARAAAHATGLPSIADDSGLCVEALGGAPGVYSARYGAVEYCRKFGAPMGVPLSPDADDPARTMLLLHSMQNVPDGRRQAAFVSAIACVLPDGREFTVRGDCNGEITRDMQGTGGFGYDPVFFIAEYGCTFGELPADIKNRISHRANALQKFMQALKAYFKENELYVNK